MNPYRTPAPTPEPARPRLLCRLGWHRWRRIVRTTYAIATNIGYRCELCGVVDWIDPHD